MSTAIEQKEMSLLILDQRESELTILAESAKDLTITGPEDKEGYKRVREKRIELKNARVSVQNDGKDLRENAIKFQKTVIAREKQLIAIISEEETRLSTIEDEYDRWIEEARIKREKEENDRIQKRVDALAKFNYAIDLYQAKIMPEEDFQALLVHAEADYLKEQERIAAEKAEQERLKREEEEKLQREREELAKQRAEQEARERELQRLEAERIEAIRKQEEATRKENERIRKEQEEREASIRVEREKLEREERERQDYVKKQEERIAEERKAIEDEKQSLIHQRRDSRMKSLFAVGLKFDGEGFVFKSEDIYINFHHSDLIAFDDTRWSTEYNKAASVMAEYHKKQEQKREQELREAQDKAAEKARIEEQERIKREEAERIERERLAKLEAERQEALKPDKEKLAKYADLIMALHADSPDVSDYKSKELLREALCDLHDLSVWLKEKSLTL